jgi:putative addiction module component (TIGR02574 family)
MRDHQHGGLCVAAGAYPQSQAVVLRAVSHSALPAVQTEARSTLLIQPIAEPPGFAALSKAEQIRYLQQLWDSISENPSEMPVPPSHLELAEQRLADYRRDPSQARSAFDVIERLRNDSKNRK